MRIAVQLRHHVGVKSLHSGLAAQSGAGMVKVERVSQHREFLDAHLGDVCVVGVWIFRDRSI